MAQVTDVLNVDAFRFATPTGDMVLVSAHGTVPTSGWSDVRLAPRFYIAPPGDGIWDLDFTADPPSGMSLQVVLPVSTTTVIGAPDWLKGVRVHGKPAVEASTSNKISLKPAAANRVRFVPKAGTIIFTQTVATYDDSFNAVGFCSGFGHIKMKKLRHELTLIVEGPSEDQIRNCVDQAVGVGLIAAIVAVYATGGGGLSAAASAFLSHLQNCLGSDFKVRLDDSSHWIEWCT